MRNYKRFLLYALTIISSICSTSVYTCESKKMLMNENGLIIKVVAGSNKIIAYDAATDSGKEAYKLELMQPYFVICESGDFYKVTDSATDSVEEALAGMVGYVPKHQVFVWTTREALAFSKVAFLEERPEIVAWSDEATLKKFMDSGNKKLAPPAFKENLESTQKREKETRPYPVLNSRLRKLRKAVDKRVYEVLLPAAIPREAKLVIDKKNIGDVEKVLTGASIVVVFDATGSMTEFALETAEAIIASVKAIKQREEDVKMGFVFFRDRDDKENLVSVPLMNIEDASNALKEVSSLMKGGGDNAEPILDAIYFATHFYPWEGDKGQMSGGRRILISVLQGDAKALTEGAIDERVPVGLDVNEIAGTLSEENIPMIAVQAGKGYGENLEVVMQTLADATSGEFIRWDEGATRKKISGALVKSMTSAATKAVTKGKKAIEAVKFDFDAGHATIPLEVVDGEMLDRLRRNGVDFNIDRGESGILVRKGFILENNDLLEPKFQINKETIQTLINLYSVLGVTGVDSESFLTSAGEAIAALAGEDYNEKDSISEIVKKKLGIEFRSELLNFDLQYLTSLVPAERLKFSKRIQDAGNTLSHYFEAHLSEFDRTPSVWMPVSALP